MQPALETGDTDTGAPPAEPRPQDPQDAGRPGRRPRDDDPAPVPLLPRPARLGVGVPVGRASASSRRCSASRDPDAAVAAQPKGSAARRAIEATQAATVHLGLVPRLSRPSAATRSPLDPASTDDRRPGGPRRGLPRRPRCGAGRGAARRPRRRRPGVALPAREDGGADDRHETRHRRLQRRRVPPLHPLPAGRSPTSGRSAPASDLAPDARIRNRRDGATFAGRTRYPFARPHASPRTSPSRGPVVPTQVKVVPMKVGVAKETAPGERRVALVPEALGKLKAAGLDILVETGAGAGSAIPDSAYQEAGATIVSTDALYRRRTSSSGSPSRPRPRSARLRSGQAVVGFLAPLIDPKPAKAPGRPGRDRDQPRRHPADAVARPDDGRAQLAGERRRLQGGPDRGQRLRPLLPAADHRGRHGQARQRPDPRHRRGRAPGDRHGPAARAPSSRPTTSGPRPASRPRRSARSSSSSRRRSTRPAPAATPAS